MFLDIGAQFVDPRRLRSGGFKRLSWQRESYKLPWFELPGSWSCPVVTLNFCFWTPHLSPCTPEHHQSRLMTTDLQNQLPYNMKRIRRKQSWTWALTKQEHDRAHPLEAFVQGAPYRDSPVLAQLLGLHCKEGVLGSMWGPNTALSPRFSPPRHSCSLLRISLGTISSS